MTNSAPVLSPQAVPDPAKTKTCTNCGNVQVDVYCARCGEKQPDHHDLTIGHFLHELVHELVHLDSKLFSTLRDLMLRPGELTAAYFAGRKKRYIAPLRMFITLFALTFLAYSAFKPAALYSLDGLMAMDPKQSLQPLMKKAAEKRGLPVSEVQMRIEQRWQKNMQLSSMLNILSVALVLKLLYVRHRRYLTEHLVFSTHFICFTYVLSLLAWPVYLVIGMKPSMVHQLLGFAVFVIGAFYVYHALRRVFGQSGAKTLGKSVAVMATTLVTGLILMGATLVAAIIHVLGA